MKSFDRAVAGSALALTASVGILVLARPGIPSMPAQSGEIGRGLPVESRLPQEAYVLAASEEPAGDAEAADGRRKARQIAPGIVAPPLPDAAVLRRAAPRPPLGELGSALPLELRRETWKPVRLARPAAVSSSEFRSGRYSVRIEGVEGVEAGRLCAEAQWPCGEQAIAALASLAGRGPLTCTLPKRATRMVVTICRAGRQDVGAWLVSNGWALALPGGPYGQAEQVARRAGMGIFGPPRPSSTAGRGTAPHGN